MLTPVANANDFQACNSSYHLDQQEEWHEVAEEQFGGKPQVVAAASTAAAAAASHPPPAHPDRLGQSPLAQCIFLQAN